MTMPEVDGITGLTWEDIDDLTRIAERHFPNEYYRLENHAPNQIALTLLWGMEKAMVDWIEDDEKEDAHETR